MEFAFMDYIEKGGVIMYVLLTLNFIGYFLMFSSFFLLIYSKFNKYLSLSDRDGSVYLPMAQPPARRKARQRGNLFIKILILIILLLSVGVVTNRENPVC